MKSKLRFLSALLTLSVLVSLFPAAAAVETPVTPMPPSWCPVDEYMVFEGSKIYLPDNWAKLKILRDYAGQGGTVSDDAWDTVAESYQMLQGSFINDSAGSFELGLVCNKLFTNYGDWDAQKGLTGGIGDFPRPDRAGMDWFQNVNPPIAIIPRIAKGAENWYLSKLWAARAEVLYYDSADHVARSVSELVSDPNFSMTRFLSAQMFENMPAEVRQELLSVIFVTLDGTVVYPGYYPHNNNKGEWQACRAINSRTMMPVRMLAELLGADVTWDGATQQVAMTRAGDAVVMTLNSMEAMVNGEPVAMDVAPIAIDGRTYIPTRYVAEFFHQKVAWSAEKSMVSITEDPEAIGGSNVGAWALPMGAMLSYMNTKHPERFGGSERAPETQKTSGRDYARSLLNGNSWGIMDRADLIDTVLRMTAYGHNTDFLNDVALIKSLTTSQYNQYLNSTGMDSYMFPYTKQLGEKWGSKGIIAWDLFRMSNLVQWGYLAGYITYPEALALMEPAAKSLKANFKSWDEAYENYLDGYNWWARNDVQGKNVWETERGKLYLKMKEEATIAPIFDDSLFKTDVISVPGVTAADLAAELR